MPVSKKQQACVHRYVSKTYDRLELTVPKGSREILKAAAEKRGVSANAYLAAALTAALNADGFALPPSKTDLNPENKPES